MKKNILLVCCISMLILLSCTKKNDIVAVDGTLLEQGNLLLTKVEGFKNKETKALVYGLLTPQERYSLWIAKLTIKLNSTGFSLEQKQIIQKIKDYLNVKVFTEGYEKEVFHTSWFPEWMAQAKKSFQDEELYKMVFSIDTEEPSLKGSGKPITNVEDNPSGCICAVGSEWTCWFPNPLGIPTYHPCTMVLNKCKKSTSGCGALFDNECDGDTCTYSVD